MELQGELPESSSPRHGETMDHIEWLRHYVVERVQFIIRLAPRRYCHRPLAVPWSPDHHEQSL